MKKSDFDHDFGSIQTPMMELDWTGLRPSPHMIALAKQALEANTEPSDIEEWAKVLAASTADLID